jgi:hypothetical protein
MSTRKFDNKYRSPKYRSPCSELEQKECLNNDNCRYNDRKQRCLSKIINNKNSALNSDITVDLLEYYCTIGELDILKYMHANGVDMNTNVGYNSNISLLEIAITHNYSDIVQWLIFDVGVDFDMDKFNLIILNGDFQINKIIVDYIREFRPNMSKTISKTLDYVFTSRLYTDDEYDEYVDIIWYFLKHRFEYTGNNSYILDIVSNYHYMNTNITHLPTDLLRKITSYQSSDDTAFLLNNPIQYVGEYIVKLTDTDDDLKKYNFRYIIRL